MSVPYPSACANTGKIPNRRSQYLIHDVEHVSLAKAEVKGDVVVVVRVNRSAGVSDEVISILACTNATHTTEA